MNNEQEQKIEPLSEQAGARDGAGSVQPLSEEQEAQIRAAVRTNHQGLAWTPRTLAPLFATLDAERTERLRVEAELQKSRDWHAAAQPIVSAAIAWALKAGNDTQLHSAVSNFLAWVERDRETTE